MDCAEGLENVLKVLDQFHHIDKVEAAIQCHQDFLSLMRKPDQRMAEFLIQFDTLANKNRNNGNQLSEEWLAFRLMQAVNVTEIEERIIKSNISELTVENIKTVLKRSYGKTTYKAVETEPLYFAKESTETKGHQLKDEDAYYRGSYWRDNKENPKTGNYRRKSPYKPYQFSRKQPLKRGKNSLDTLPSVIYVIP